jgi:hypothetical protein
MRFGGRIGERVINLLASFIMLLSPPIGGGVSSVLPEYTPPPGCPEQTPEPTPLDVSWQYDCQGCVVALTPEGSQVGKLQQTATAQVATQQYLTGTPTPTQEMTPTITPTSSVTQEPHWFAVTYGEELYKYWDGPDCGGWCPELNLERKYFSCGADAIGYGVFSTVTITGKANLRQPFSMTWREGSQYSGNYGTIFTPIGSNGDCEIAAGIYQNLTGFEMSGLTGTNYFQCIGDNNWTFAYESTWWTDYRTKIWSASYNRQYGSYTAIPHGILCYGLEENPTPEEPTPTPTITPTSQPAICNDWQYSDGIGIVTLPNVTITTGSCFTVIPGFEFTLPDADQTEVGWDGVEICPEWVQISNASIMGVTISMDLIALVFVIFFLGLISVL